MYSYKHQIYQNKIIFVLKLWKSDSAVYTFDTDMWVYAFVTLGVLLEKEFGQKQTCSNAGPITGTRNPW